MDSECDKRLNNGLYFVNKAEPVVFTLSPEGNITAIGLPVILLLPLPGWGWAFSTAVFQSTEEEARKRKSPIDSNSMARYRNRTAPATAWIL